MTRAFLTALVTAAFLAAPTAFGPAAPHGLSGSAMAGVNYNASKSNSGNVQGGGPNGGHTTGTSKGKH
jgi:hypothetical protein